MLSHRSFLYRVYSHLDIFCLCSLASPTLDFCLMASTYCFCSCVHYHLVYPCLFISLSNSKRWDLIQWVTFLENKFIDFCPAVLVRLPSSGQVAINTELDLHWHKTWISKMIPGKKSWAGRLSELLRRKVGDLLIQKGPSVMPELRSREFRGFKQECSSWCILQSFLWLGCRGWAPAGGKRPLWRQSSQYRTEIVSLRVCKSKTWHFDYSISHRRMKRPLDMWSDCLLTSPLKSGLAEIRHDKIQSQSDLFPARPLSLFQSHSHFQWDVSPLHAQLSWTCCLTLSVEAPPSSSLESLGQLP